MELPFDSHVIADLWETIGYLSKYLVFMVSESQNSSISLYSHFICEPHTYQRLIFSCQYQLHLGTIGQRYSQSLMFLLLEAVGDT